MHAIRRWSVAALLVTGGLVHLAQAGPSSARPPAPSFSATTLERADISLNDLRGKVVLLSFWASWCRSCIDGLPDVKALYAAHVDDGFEIVGISLDEEPKAARRVVAEHRLDWPQICDGLGKESPLARDFDVRGTPRYVLIDREGRISDDRIRPSELAAAVRELLATPN